jgi:hypothetical protein
MSVDHFGTREEMIDRYRDLQSELAAKVEECERLRKALEEIRANHFGTRAGDMAHHALREAK